MSVASVPVSSKIGTWFVEGDDDGLAGVHLVRSRRAPSVPSAPPRVQRAAKQLAEYFEGRRRVFDVDLHLTGTDFQQNVWLALAAIPYGEVRSYGEIADEVGRPHAYRAVGNANGKNPWPVIIPCHRVVAAHDIGGYAIGLDVKRFLLQLEGVANYG